MGEKLYTRDFNVLTASTFAHIKHLDDEDIPIHMGETTKKMLDSWETT